MAGIRNQLDSKKRETCVKGNERIQCTANHLKPMIILIGTTTTHYEGFDHVVALSIWSIQRHFCTHRDEPKNHGKQTGFCSGSTEWTGNAPEKPCD